VLEKNLFFKEKVQFFRFFTF